MSLLQGDDGEYYAVPLGLSYAGYVWANMSYFDKYNLELPTNYDELKEVCQTFRDNGEYPLVIGAKDSWINIDTWMNIAADINTEKLYSAIEGETPFTDEDLDSVLPDLAELLYRQCFPGWSTWRRNVYRFH